MLKRAIESIEAGQPIPSQGEVRPAELHTRYSNRLHSHPQQSDFLRSNPILSQHCTSPPYSTLQPLSSRRQPSSYSTPYPKLDANPDGVSMQRPLPPLHSPDTSKCHTQYQPQQLPSIPGFSTSAPVPHRSKLQALPQSQSLESALNDADLESLRALLRASGNLYPHMRKTILRFLLGDNYVEEERNDGWTIEGLVDKNKVEGSSASVNEEKEYLGNNGRVGKAKEKSANLEKIQHVSGIGLVIDLVSDDEDNSEKKSDNSEKQPTAERTLAKSLEEERKKTQDLTVKTWEMKRQKDATELAFKEENTRRIKAELALSAEGRKREIAEQGLKEARKRMEKAQSAYADEHKTRIFQEKLWMEDQLLVAHNKKVLAQDKTEIKSLVSAAQQYINVVEAGCDATMLEIAKAGATSKRWIEMYEKTYNFDAEHCEMSKKPGIIDNKSSLAAALMKEKKKRAETVAELEVVREELRNVIKHYQSEWMQVESLQKQIGEMQAEAMDRQTALPELKARSDVVEQSLQQERSYHGTIQKHLSDGRKERKSDTELLETQRRGSFTNGGFEYQSNSTTVPRTIGILSKEKEDLEEALEAEKARSEWLRKQFFDQHKTVIEEHDIPRKLHEEIAKRKLVEKALEMEKKLRKIAERTSNNERSSVDSNSGLGVENGAERVLKEAKEEDFDGRIPSQAATNEPLPSKKRRRTWMK